MKSSDILAKIDQLQKKMQVSEYLINKYLINKTKFLNDADFIIRLLYKHSY